MKKVFLAILAFIYLGVSSGISMNLHYCMGKLAYVDFQNAKEKCRKCGMKTNAGGCCKHEYKIVKLNDTHKLVSNHISIFSPASVLIENRNICAASFSALTAAAQFNSHSPPFFQTASRCILHCIFRI